MKPEVDSSIAITKLDRRTFLKLTGLAGGGLMLGVTVSCSPNEEAGSTAGTSSEQPFEPNAYVQITPEGIVIQAPNPEIGQGVRTSLPMIVAEELDAAWEDVTVRQAEVDQSRFGPQMSVGSRSIPQRWMPLRQAGATARHMLVAAAALRWEVDPAECETRDSQVIHRPTGRTLSYLELASAAAELPVPDPGSVKLKDPSEFRLLGKRIAGVDNTALATGCVRHRQAAAEPAPRNLREVSGRWGRGTGCQRRRRAGAAGGSRRLRAGRQR